MLLKDYLAGKNLFATIAPLVTIPALTANANLLDSLLVANYGKKTMFDSYSELSINVLAQMISMQFEQSWLYYIEAEALLEGVFDEVETITSRELISINQADKTETDKVAGFNSEALVTTESSEATNTDNNNQTEEISVKRVDKNLEKAYSLLSTYGKNSVFNFFLSDVNDFLTIKMYEAL